MKFNKELSSKQNSKKSIRIYANKWKKLTGRDPVVKNNFIVTTWKEFAKNSSIHTIKYLSADDVNAFGRLFWFIVIVVGMLATTYCCMLLSERFRSNLTATVIETTNYKVTEIPFPKVTLCNNNELNYNLTDKAIAKFAINRTEKQKDFLRKYLYILQNMQYGSFDEYKELQNESYDGSLDDINTTAIYRFMMHKCEDFFVECKWRGKKVNCCDIFSRQVTEYGYCFSMNSYSNEGSPHVNRSHNFPWRVAKQGKDTGVTALMHLRTETKVFRAEGNDKLGIFIFVQHPAEHPAQGQFIAVKSRAAVIIKPTAFSTSSDVSRLPPADRQCYYDYEASKLKGMTLNGLPYKRTNCIAACKQHHMMKQCNCSYTFLFFTDAENPECTISQAFCLRNNNNFFMAENPLTKNKFFENETGIECRCLPECSRIEYSIKIETIFEEPKLEGDVVKVDVHYGSTTMIKYRTDVMSSWIDLMVGFGGILGLFFGCSILSGFELFFFSTIALYHQYKKGKEKIIKSVQSKIPFLK